MNVEQIRNLAPRLLLFRRLKIAIWITTVIVLLLVGMMRQVKIELPAGISFSFLPPVYSVINTAVAILLVIALVMIKRGNVLAHRRIINLAMIGSILFLVCYVLYHFTNEETKFEGVGAIRWFYFILLISHIVLAAVSLPLILLTWSYGMTHQFEKHKKLARWVFPVWLYVAISGPVCYLLLIAAGR